MNPINSSEIDAARRAFLICFHCGKAHRETPFWMSTKAHRKGKQFGFANQHVHMLWGYFLSGWKAKSNDYRIKNAD
jgi:hypothetical protein